VQQKGGRPVTVPLTVNLQRFPSPLESMAIHPVAFPWKRHRMDTEEITGPMKAPRPAPFSQKDYFAAYCLAISSMETDL